MMQFHDTPIDRVTFDQLPISELNDFIAQLQTRRLRAYTVYQAAQEAKANKQADATQASLDKRIEQFQKKLISVDKGLSDLEKYAVEILSMRMALGHKI
jgi:hypothetical protein